MAGAGALCTRQAMHSTSRAQAAIKVTIHQGGSTTSTVNGRTGTVSAMREQKRSTPSIRS